LSGLDIEVHPFMSKALLCLILIFSLSGFNSGAQAQTSSSGWDAKPVTLLPSCLRTSSQKTALIYDLLNAVLRYKNAQGMFNSDGYPREGLFSGSYDWHSSVHAHWALITMLEYIRDEDFLKGALRKFTGAQLLRERNFLNSNPKHDLYGQAWLLLLISSLERHFPYKAINENMTPEERTAILESPGYQLRSLKQETFVRVTNWLSQNGSATNICSGTYSSWSFIYLLVKLSQTSPENLNLLKNLDRQLMAAPACTEATASSDAYVQVSVLLDLLGKKSGYVAHSNNSLLSVDSLSTEGNGHPALRALSSYWRLPVTEKFNPEEKKVCRAFDGFLFKMRQQHSVWSGNFETLGHVAPQFIWFGMWLDQVVLGNEPPQE
jgi:hypothetical protein